MLHSMPAALHATKASSTASGRQRTRWMAPASTALATTALLSTTACGEERGVGSIGSVATTCSDQLAVSQACFRSLANSPPTYQGICRDPTPTPPHTCFR